MLGDILKYLREREKLNQKELSEKLNISRVRYNQYETGRRVPDKDTLVLMANFFKVSTDYLLENNPNSNEMSSKSLNKCNAEELVTKIRELAKKLDVTEIEVYEKFIGGENSLENLYNALKLIESVQSSKKE